MATGISSPVFTVKSTGSPPATTAPRIRAMRAHDWAEGAVLRARQERLDGTLHFVGQMEGDFIFRCFESATSRVEHSLIINWEKKSLRCTCWDHNHEYPCAHIGALYLHFYEIQQSAVPKNINHHTLYPWWSNLSAS